MLKCCDVKGGGGGNVNVIMTLIFPQGLWTRPQHIAYYSINSVVNYVHFSKELELGGSYLVLLLWYIPVQALWARVALT